MIAAKAEFEITRNPADGSYGFVCRTHGYHRYGLTQAHAVNLENQHRRDHHTPVIATIANGLVLDLTAAAVRVGAAYLVQEFAPDSHPPIIDLWESMTGLDHQTAKELADWLVANTDHHTAAVVPL